MAEAHDHGERTTVSQGETIYRKPDYKVVETSMEMSAYYMTTR